MSNNRQTFLSSLTSIFSLVKEHYIFFSIFSLVISFLYVQGMYSPFFGFDVHPNAQVAFPVSKQLIVMNGIYFIFNLLFAFLISFTLWKVKHLAKDELKLIKISSVNLYNGKRLKGVFSTREAKITICFLLIIILSFIQMYIMGVYPDFVIKNVYIFFLGYYGSFFYLTITIAFHINNKIEESSSAISISTSSHTIFEKKMSYIFFCFLALFIAVVLSISFQVFGMLFQTHKIINFENVGGSTKMADIYTKDEKYSYVYIDLSKDFFVGRNLAKRTTEIIPIKSIEKIEVWNAGPISNKTKLSNDYVTSEDTAQIIQKAQDYYKYRLEEPSASIIESLLTQNLYRVGYSAPPSILQKKWDTEKEYSGRKISEFYGFELSEPVPTKTGYIIYAIEHWKKDKLYVEYGFVDEAGTWKIDSVKDAKPFRF